MHKVLIISNVISMITLFNMNNIEILQSQGYEVHVACNFTNTSFSPETQNRKYVKMLEEKNVVLHQVDFGRRTSACKTIVVATGQICKILRDDYFEFVHCHSQIAGLCGRLAAKRYGIKSIYTAHGFMFYKGASKLNWFLFFPQEWIQSWFTDVLITINREDYRLAQKYLHARSVAYVPGVGIDTKKIQTCNIDKITKRKELKIPENAFVLISVGELQERKNQKVVIEAIHKLREKNIYYLIVGEGELRTVYESLIEAYNLEKQIFLLGYRTDVFELCKAADCFIHPAKREGLGLAPLEGMASGLPLISSDVNGMKDYVKEGITGCCVSDVTSVDEIANAINYIYSNVDFRNMCGRNNIKIAEQFDVLNANKIMMELYACQGELINSENKQYDK